MFYPPPPQHKCTASVASTHQGNKSTATKLNFAFPFQVLMAGGYGLNWHPYSTETLTFFPDLSQTSPFPFLRASLLASFLHPSLQPLPPPSLEIFLLPQSPAEGCSFFFLPPQPLICSSCLIN